MKYLLLLLLFSSQGAVSQVLIHAHNDYQKKEPLTAALRSRVFSVEADVWLVNNDLLVAHEEAETRGAPTLDALYLQPIIALFQKNSKRVSEDKGYAPVLMIDIKRDGPRVLPRLVEELGKHPQVFDRNQNPLAVQVVISGDRGPVDKWKEYPSFIQFDGRPYESYDSSTLAKVAFISDTYIRYATTDTRQTEDRIKKLATGIHALHKYLRLWAIPDNPGNWKQLLQWGVDIINTDKVAECREQLQGTAW